MTTISRHKDELYGNRSRFRLITIVGSHGLGYDVRLSWGSFAESNKTTSQLAVAFGIHEACLLAATRGSERWWHALTADQLRARLKQLRKSAEAAQFKFVGEEQ